jgi:putative membrane protein
MEKILIRFIAVVLGLFLASHVVSGIVVTGLYPAIIVALVLGFLNLIVRPILVVLTLPITILTLGLFVFIINGLLFYFVGTIVKGFEVQGFVPALLGSIIVSVVSALIQKLT